MTARGSSHWPALVTALLASATCAVSARASEETLTGEVVALWCYVIEGKTGRVNAGGARNCYRLGSPLAIKVGKTLYIVANDDRKLKNRLVGWAGNQVTAHGTIGEMQDGHPTITISSVERVKR